jgi:uncharacterized protein (DUF983 family)
MPAAAGPVSLMSAMWRGFRGRCPHCSEGRLFGHFLKVADRCASCGEELLHHRADDLPAYLVIVLVGHAVVPAVLAVETAYAPPVALQLLVWLPVTLVASLALLQPVKGAVVGLQWRTGMHGFDESKRRRTERQSTPAILGLGNPGRTA